MLDRIAPTRRPEGANSGTQIWKELLFLHWAFPLEVVRPLVPAALDLDAWDGKAWVGLVPFKMEAVRPSFVPRALAMDFLETNVRTYVHHRGEPGVYFFSLEAASRLAVRAARIMWGLPYWFAEMTSTREDRRMRYGSRRIDGGARLEVAWEIGELLGPSAPDTFEHFLLERYLLYANKRGVLRKGQVHHVPYPASRATVSHLEESLLAAAGFAPPNRAPDAVHYSEGVDVEVFGPWNA